MEEEIQTLRNDLQGSRSLAQSLEVRLSGQERVHSTVSTEWINRVRTEVAELRTEVKTAQERNLQERTNMEQVCKGLQTENQRLSQLLEKQQVMQQKLQSSHEAQRKLLADLNHKINSLAGVKVGVRPGVEERAPAMSQQPSRLSDNNQTSHQNGASPPPFAGAQAPGLSDIG